MQTGRRRPELDAEPFFDADEIRSACFLTDVKQPAWSKLNEELRLIARQVDSLAAKATANPVRKPSGCDSETFMSLPRLYERYAPAVMPTLLYKTMGSTASTLLY